MAATGRKAGTEPGLTATSVFFRLAKRRVPAARLPRACCTPAACLPIARLRPPLATVRDGRDAKQNKAHG